MKITLYSKPDCPLCDELKAELDILHMGFGFTLVDCNIEEDEVAFQRYRYLIPVLDIENGPILYPPHTMQTTRQALVDASNKSAQ
jgi:glutaredoxin